MRHQITFIHLSTGFPHFLVRCVRRTERSAWPKMALAFAQLLPLFLLLLVFITENWLRELDQREASLAGERWHG